MTKIRRPPCVETFAVPDRDELLALKTGDHVKLIFESDDGAERMWVVLKRKLSNEEWEGDLDNNPMGIDLKIGATVKFHPFDVIRTMPKE